MNGKHTPLSSNQVITALSTLIKEKGISQNQLADSTGLKQGNISRILHADYNPKLDNLLLIMNAAGISLEELSAKVSLLSSVKETV